MAEVTVYYGKRENMLAEVSAWDPCQIGVRAVDCRYLIKCCSDAEFETEWCSSKAEARHMARELAKVYNCKICPV